MRNGCRSRSGQVLVMYTMSLFMIIGIMALAVDLGLAYYNRRAAQSAADAAARAAVTQALKLWGQEPGAGCPSSGVQCSATNYSCAGKTTASNNLDNGCLYAAQHGFTDEGNQTVKLDAGLGDPPGLGVKADYWVTARVSQTAGALFSAIFGSSFTSGARATAVVTMLEKDASLILTNRVNDPDLGSGGVKIPGGVNLDMNGSGGVAVPGGVLMASTADGSARNSNFAQAGKSEAGQIWSAFAYINENDAQSGKAEDPGKFYDPTGVYKQPPENRGDGPRFHDPEVGKEQPSATSSDGLPVCLVPSNGTITPAMLMASGTQVPLAPAIYVAVDDVANPTAPSFSRISFKGSGFQLAAKASSDPSAINLNFGANCPVGDWTTGGSNTAFGNYVFYGGLTNQGSGGTPLDDVADLQIQAGAYFIAGVKWKNANSPGQNAKTLDLGSNMSLRDTQPAGTASSYPGELFFLTDAQYSGLPAANAHQPSMWPAILTQLQTSSGLKMGPSSIQAGSSNVLKLHGINKDAPLFDGTTDPYLAALAKFDKVMLWQDQRNSAIKYTPGGEIDCGTPGKDDEVSGPGCLKETARREADNVDASYDTTQLIYKGSANAELWGMWYQPRGSFLTLGGSTLASAESKLQVVVGAVNFSGGGSLKVNGIAPAARRVVALVQ